MLENLYRCLKEQDVEIYERYSLARLSSINIGGEAAILVKPLTEKALTEVVKILYGFGVRYKTVGRMTNILPPDKGYDGVIVSTARLTGYSFSGTVLTAECGVVLGAIAQRLADLGLGGIEELCGIPGSVGGLITLNGGAFGKELSDVLISAKVYSAVDGRVYCLSPDELSMSYRHSAVGERGLTVLSAELRLSVAERDIIIARLKELRDIRRRTQPLDMPSLGSVFKRHPDGAVSKMIDECGLKGLRAGGAEISCKHAGFIVNTGGATADQVIELIEICKNAVRERFGILPEPEIEILN